MHKIEIPDVKRRSEAEGKDQKVSSGRRSEAAGRRHSEAASGSRFEAAAERRSGNNRNVRPVPGPGQAGIKGFLKTRIGKLSVAAVVILLVWFASRNFISQSSYVRKGIAMCNKGNYSEAQTCFQNAVIKDNLNPDNYYYYGIACLGNGEIDHAMKQFQLAINIDPEHQGAFRGLGIGFLKKEEYQKAIECFNKSIDYSGSWINKVDYDILWYRSEAEMAIKDYDAAVYTYGALLELEGDLPITRYYRGHAYCLQGKKAEAMADFDAAIGEGKKSYELFWNIYDSMMQGGWEDEALHYLTLTTQAGYVDGGKGSSAKDNEKYKGMIAYLCGDYHQAITILSSEAFAADEQCSIYLALAYEQIGDYKNAEKLFLKEKEKDTADQADYNRIARYYIRRREGENAAKILEEGIEKFSAMNVETLRYNLVTAYEVNGKYQEALERVKKYASSYGDSDQTKHETAFLKERIRK